MCFCVTVSSYNSSTRTPRKTPFLCCQECVFIGPLPSNGWPIVESVTSEMCLPSRCLAKDICVTIFWYSGIGYLAVVWHVGETCRFYHQMFFRNPPITLLPCSQETYHVSTTKTSRLMLLGKQSLFIARTLRNHKCILWTEYSFSIVKQVVHIVTAALLKAICEPIV
jgi:hypothetical protein